MPPARKSSLPSLAGADWLGWPGTVKVFSALAARGHEVRAVGGAVRDTLLSRPVREVDFATTALPEEVMEMAAEGELKTAPTGIGHGTVTVIVGSRGFEVTTLRKDVETYGRRARVAYTDNWAADASRRDFTINALYAEADGTLFDPIGAVGDIEARRVRFIGDARARVREDFLRILRFFRFNAELQTDDFDSDGLLACVSERAGLQDLSGERVRTELLRLLAAPGASMALRKMFDYGLLVQVLGGVPHLARLDRLIEIEAAIDAEPDAALRLAALAVEVVEDAERLAERLRLSNVERSLIEQAAFYREVTSSMGEIDVMRLLYRRGRAGSRATSLMAWAATGDADADEKWRGLIARIDDLPIPTFPLKGADIVRLGLSQGPVVGEILKRVEAHWIAGGFAVKKAKLLKMAQALVKSGGAEA